VKLKFQSSGNVIYNGLFVNYFFVYFDLPGGFSQTPQHVASKKIGANLAATDGPSFLRISCW